MPTHVLLPHADIKTLTLMHVKENLHLPSICVHILHIIAMQTHRTLVTLTLVHASRKTCIQAPSTCRPRPPWMGHSGELACWLPATQHSNAHSLHRGTHCSRPRPRIRTLMSGCPTRGLRQSSAMQARRTSKMLCSRTGTGGWSRGGSGSGSVAACGSMPTMTSLLRCLPKPLRRSSPLLLLPSTIPGLPVTLPTRGMDRRELRA